MGSGLDILRAWCMWNGLIVGILTAVGFFIHFFNGTREGVTECDQEAGIEPVTFLLQNGKTQNLGQVECMGPFLRWSTGKDAAGDDVSTVGDINYFWRKTFTFKPQEFLDLWTPCFLGILQVLQHFGEATRWPALSKGWLNVGIWGAILAFWAQFGYAGNFGVFVGFYTTCGWLPFVLLAVFCDKSGDICVLNLGATLGLEDAFGTSSKEDGGQENDSGDGTQQQNEEAYGNEA